MNIQNMLGDAIAKIVAAPGAGKGPYSAFLGLKGDDYRNELMVVGRAVNGWTEWTPDAVQDATGRDRLMGQLLERKENVCPLSWVTDTGTGYNTRRSAFWRTARRVLDGVTGKPSDDASWSSRLAWSNLYKISLDGGNPAGWMYEPQEAACIGMLDEELRSFRPKRVLFSTGFDWAEPFVRGSDLSGRLAGARHVEGFGLLGVGEDRIPAVVATHPMTRPEDEWVAEVVAAFAQAEQLTG